MTSKCVVCDEPFKEGDIAHAFLRCPEEPEGSWTTPVELDSGYQDRAAKTQDSIKRKHATCLFSTIPTKRNLT